MCGCEEEERETPKGVPHRKGGIEEQQWEFDVIKKGGNQLDRKSN